MCMRLHMPFNPPHMLLPKSSFVCTHLVITHSGHKTYRILNWTEVPNALKEFMLHNCTGLPENKQWCIAKIFSQGDDSDPSLWLRPCLAADGANCNLSSQCRAREDKQKTNARSRGHKMRKHKLFGAFGGTQCFNLFWIKATLEIMEKKTKPHQYYTSAHLQVEDCGWFCAGWQNSCVPGGSHPRGQPADSTGHSCTSGVHGSGVGGFPTLGCPEMMRLPKMPLLLLGPMNGQVWVFCSPRRLWASPLYLYVSLPRAVQILLVAGLLCLYRRNVFATESAVCVVFAVTVLTLNIFPYFVFSNNYLCPKDIIWLLVIKLIFQPRLQNRYESFTLRMWHSTAA